MRSEPEWEAWYKRAEENDRKAREREQQIHSAPGCAAAWVRWALNPAMSHHQIERMRWRS